MPKIIASRVSELEKSLNIELLSSFGEMAKNLAIYRHQHFQITFLSHHKSQAGSENQIVHRIYGFSNLFFSKHFGSTFAIFSKISEFSSGNTKKRIYFSMQKTRFFINPKYYANFVCTWHSPFYEISLKLLFDACSRIIQNIQIKMLLIDQGQVRLCHRYPTNIDSLIKQ